MLNFYLRSRMPIEEALELIYQDTKLECCLRLSESLRNGKELAKGLREIGLTDGFIYSCLSIGENTGDYPSAFGKIIAYSDRRLEDRKYLTRVLSYPALLLFFTVLLLGFILFSVTPQLYKIIESTGGRFPAVLEILYALNGILTQHGRLWAILAAGLLFAVLSGLFDRGAKKHIRRILLKNYFVRTLYRVYMARDIFWQIKVLTDADMNIVSALRIVAENSDSQEYREILSETASGIEEGNTFSQMLDRYATVFPPAVIRYVRLGESTDQFPKSLDSIVGYLNIKADDLTENAKKIIQPLTIVLAAGMVSLILAMVLPIIESASSMGGLL